MPARFSACSRKAFAMASRRERGESAAARAGAGAGSAGFITGTPEDAAGGAPKGEGCGAGGAPKGEAAGI